MQEASNKLFVLCKLYRGTRPCPRSNHVATLYDDKTLLIFGGASKSKTLNDLYSLDFETVCISNIATSPLADYVVEQCNCFGCFFLLAYNGSFVITISSDDMVKNKDTGFSSITKSWLLWSSMWNKMVHSRGRK